MYRRLLFSLYRDMLSFCYTTICTFIRSLKIYNHDWKSTFWYNTYTLIFDLVKLALSSSWHFYPWSKLIELYCLFSFFIFWASWTLNITGHLFVKLGQKINSSFLIHTEQCQLEIKYNKALLKYVQTGVKLRFFIFFIFPQSVNISYVLDPLDTCTIFWFNIDNKDLN